MGFARVLSLWGPVLLFAGLIFLLSSFSFHVKDEPFSHFDKVAHLMEYGFLCLLLFRAFRGTFLKTSFFPIAVWTFMFTVAYGATDEFHQAYTPFRHSDVFDLMVDGLGALLVLVTVFLWERREAA